VISALGSSHLLSTEREAEHRIGERLAAFKVNKFLKM